MIEVTVKTLDAKNHVFTVSEELSVKDFKEEISPTVTIPAVEQRLIFRGRVLQDEKKISEYNVANNTIHLVQRPTQSSGGTQNDEPPSRNTGSADDRFNLEGGGGGIIITAGTNPSDRNAIIMGTIGIPTIDIPVSEQNVNATGLRRNSAALRLQNGTEMVNKASSLLQKLEEDDEIARVTSQAENASVNESNNMETEHSQSHGPDAGGMELDPDDPASFGRMISQVANAASHAAVLSSVRAFQNSANTETTGSAHTEGEHPPQVSGNNSQNSSAGNPSNNNLNAARRAEAPRLRDMAIALQDLLAFHERLTPFLSFVQNILRENRVHSTDTGELRSVQYAFDTISEVLHYLGHSYHSYSDLMCDFAVAPENRRISAPATILVEQSTVVRATIPIAVPTFAAQPNMGQQPTAQQQPTATHGSTGNAAPASQNVPNAPTGQLPTFPGMNQTPPQGVNAFHSHGGPGFSINIQSNGMPDLAAILGPALAGAGGGAGMLPFLSLGGLQANLRQQQQAQQQNTQNQPQQPTQNQSNSGQNAATNNVTSGPTQANSRPSQPNSNPIGTTQNPNPASLLRSDHMTPAFDVLLSCHSHHANRSIHNRRRPDDLHNHISAVRNNSEAASSDSSYSAGFIEGLIDLARYSGWLELLQPQIKDVVQNYLMRGRDVKNSQHLKTCARGLAKKIMPFFQSITDSISTKDEKIAYQQTFSELVTKFYFKLLSLVVSSGPTRQFRTSILLLWEESVSKLFAIFRLCFPNNTRVPEIFAKALVDEFFGGMPLVFRSYTRCRLAEYFAVFSAQADSTNMPAETAGVIFISEDKVSNDETPTTGTNVEPSSSVSYNALLTMAERLLEPTQNSSPLPAASAVAAAAEIPKPKKSTAVPVVDEAMDTDIDNLIDHLPAPFSPEETRLDGPLRNIPTEWRDTVRHDIRRQLGMIDQPPPSPGFCALFPRKN